ncbi:MAG: HAD-IC family P-type ATPase [Micrococcales bacterium]|nr:HAD-IC family P-type ATPase [Micrococcales bacterium]
MSNQPAQGLSSAEATQPVAGLSSAEVAQRVAAGQVNATPGGSSRSAADIWRANIFTPFNALLLSLAAVVIVVDRGFMNALFGMVMVFNSGIGIFQELRAKRKLDRLAILNAPRATVVRDGQAQEVAVEQVVLGDTLKLTLGDQVVADGQVIESRELEIDESLLTGESDPVVKAVNEQVLSGSIVVAGSGHIHVTAVGADSYSYKIAAHAKRFRQAKSELLHSTNRLLKWISWMLIVVAPVLIWGQLRISTDNWRQAVVKATAAIVGMIPEGLVLLTSMAFMLAAVALTRRQVLVQQMPAVEGLARVDTLLLDKTGTLTEGSIRFEAMAEVEANDQAKDRLDQVLVTLASRSANPTNLAILEAFPNTEPFEVSGEVPFSSARKWSAITTSKTTWVMGAPEILFAASPTDRHFVKAKETAAQGKRVLALMSGTGPLAGQTLPPQMRCQALIVLSERIRPDAGETLGYFAQQGVDIKIISGDSPLTVAAVARQVGVGQGQAVAFDARDLPDAGPDLEEIVNRCAVFGRVQPEQKRQIAQCLQAQGRVVAMTGDGVNDALALKDADIGIAMNSGAAATKAVAELVLLDNKFSHLPKVLAEGRRVIANIERVANLFLIKNVYSLAMALAVTVAGFAYPYQPSQMTVISALTIGIPAFFLALGPNSRIYQPGFLKRVLEFAIPVGVICAAAMMVNYTLIQKSEVSTVEAGTSTSIVLVIVGWWVLFCLARPLRPWKVALIAAVAGLYIMMVTVPWLAELFHFAVKWQAVPVAVLVGAIGAGLVEVVWRLTRP